MDKINGLNHIVQVLQSHISKSKEKSRAGKSSKNDESGARQSSRISIEELEAQIAVRLRQLDKSRPDYRDAAVDIFLDEVLCWEFGSGISSDPEFGALKQKINTTLKEHRALDSGFDKVLGKLGA